jgi:membrane protease YdiL (CAAX protease family)
VTDGKPQENEEGLSLPPSLISRIFFNRHDELRTGWRMVTFVLLVAVLAFLFVRPVAVLLPGAGQLLISFLFVVALLAASWIMTRFVNGKPMGAIGLGFHHRTFWEFGMGCLLGLLMMAGVFLVHLALGYVSFLPLGLSAGEIAGRVAVSALFFLLGAAGEELMFRGYFFQTFMQGVTFLPAAVIMSVLFGISHLANPHVSTFAAINVALAGFWLSFAYLKTRSLWFPIGLHAAWNFSQTTLFSFPTSGLDFLGKRLFMSTVSGPEWVTGGAFGPEGGLLATVALVFGTWFILKSTLITQAEGVITLDSLEDLLPPAPTKEQ